MKLAATSLRNNVEVTDNFSNKNVNFGKNHDNKKNTTAKQVAIYTGTALALATLAFVFRKKIVNTKAFKNIEQKTDKVYKQVKQTTDAFYEKTKETLGENFSKIKNKTSKIFSKQVKENKPFSSFDQNEAQLLMKFRKTGANQQGVFDTLKKYGMTDTEEKYVKETMSSLKENFAKRKAKSISMRSFLNESLKKDKPEAIIKDLIDNSKNLRQKWNL